MMRPSYVLALLTLAACGNDAKVGTFNTAPSVSITSPPDGSAYNEGDTISFQARVDDDQTAASDLFLDWTAEPGGELSSETTADAEGNVTFSTASIPPGNIVVRLTATDDQAQQGLAEITVTISDLPDAPTIAVIHPIAGEHAEAGTDYRFVVQVGDAQQSADALHIEFESDIDGVFCTPTADASGYAECNHDLSPGEHTLVFSVTDESSERSEATAYFSVLGSGDIDNDGDGWTETMGDCDDGDASVNPSADEYNNGRDDDCDGHVDEGTSGGDDDGDGYSEDGGDCNDAYSGAYPGAPEICDGIDNDCNTVIDDGTTCYDDDGDGYRELDGDCDDANAATYPGAGELQDGQDNDCDGTIDEGTGGFDDDRDGYTEDGGDCDDGNASINPAATETCNGLDDNCDSSVDPQNASGCSTYYYDGDRDGYGAGSGACLCGASGGYDSRYGNDCYDSNASANPSATSYSSSNRGDGSYDFNCDGAQTPYYTSSFACDTDWTGFSCDTHTDGWNGGTPSCGARGTWYSGCSASWFSCYNDSSASLTQSCR